MWKIPNDLLAVLSSYFLSPHHVLFLKPNHHFLSNSPLNPEPYVLQTGITAAFFLLFIIYQTLGVIMTLFNEFAFGLAPAFQINDRTFKHSLTKWIISVWTKLTVYRFGRLQILYLSYIFHASHEAETCAQCSFLMTSHLILKVIHKLILVFSQERKTYHTKVYRRVCLCKSALYRILLQFCFIHK